MKKRFLLADDHSLVLDGIRGLIEPEHEVVGVAKNGRELVAAAQRLCPDVIILDISMPLLNGLEALRQLQRIGLHPKCIVVTMHASVEFAVDAIRLRASGFVLKADASSELQDALREIFAGRIFVTPSMDDDVQTAFAERALPVRRARTTRRSVSHNASGNVCNSSPRGERSRTSRESSISHRGPPRITNTTSKRS